MPGRQAKIITPTMLRRMLERRRQPSNNQPRPRHHLAVGQGRPARLRDRAARLVDGARRARAGRRLPRGPRRHRQEARRSAHPDASQPRARAGRAQASAQRRWGQWFARRVAAACGRPASSTGSPPCSPAWSLRAVRRIRAAAASLPAAARNAHKTGCSLRDVQLLAGHKSIRDHPGLYRRRHARAAAAGGVALSRAQLARCGVRGDATPEPSRREHGRNPWESANSTYWDKRHYSKNRVLRVPTPKIVRS